MQKFLLDPVRHKPRFWDGLIAALCCLGIAGVLLLPFAGKALSAIALAFLLYCCFVEPWIIVTKKLAATLKTDEPFTIAFVSDFHVGPYKGKGFMRRIVRKTNALGADLILLGGDFLYNYESDPHLLDPLRELKAPLGVFAIMGNHDSGRDCLYGRTVENPDRTKDVEAALSDCGITTLHNEWKKVGPVVLAGTDDYWMKTYDLGKTLDGIPAGEPVVLLTHNPDAVMDERTHRADLILCGHTHGGQVRLPLIGAVVPIPNEIGRTYDRGTFALPKETTLIVSHGVGESMARPRFLTVPEILLIGVGNSEEQA